MSTTDTPRQGRHARGAYPTWVPDDLHDPPEADLELAGRLAMEVARSPVRSVRPILGRGTVNWVVVAEAGDTAVVVRLTRQGDDRQVLDKYRKEAWCLERAAEIGLPGPRPLSIGEYEGRSYMVLTYVPGESGAGVPMDVLGVWKELGGYASRIARIPVTGFGDHLADPSSGRFDDSFHSSWRDRIEYNLDRISDADPFIELGIYDASHVGMLSEHFREMLMDEWEVALCHGDLAPHNTIVDGAGTVHLMDWGAASVDAWPETVVADARRMLYLGRASPAAVGWFVDGMELPDPRSARFRTRVERVMLLKAFDRARWALERKLPNLETIVSEAYQVWHGLRLGSQDG